MVVLNPVSAALGVAQLGMGIASAFSEQNQQAQQYASEVGQATFSNLMSRNRTRMMNEYRQRAFGRQVEFAKQQQAMNRDAASRAYATEQARFNEQMLQFSFQKEGMLNQLMQQQGLAAASERFGRSASRAAAIQNLGQFGRNQAMFAESMASAARQSARNVDEIRRQRYQADLGVYGQVMEGPIPEMMEPLYQAGPAPSSNTALKIGTTLLNSTQTFFGGAQSYNKAGTLVPFMS